MKVELHLHTSRYSACATEPPEEILARLVETGYDAVFITEHDVVWPEEDLEDLRGLFPGLRIFGGVELTLEDDLSAQHLLVLGTSDPGYLRLTDPADILEKARAAGNLTVLAHPTRWHGGARMIYQGLRPDAIEVRSCNQNGESARVAETLAAEYDLPTVHAGDVHGLGFVDAYWIETHRPIEDARDIRGIVLDGAYSLERRE